MIIINLIPSNLWDLNLRKMLGPLVWDKLSLRVREQQSWTCQACNISLKQLKQKKWFHTHEYWKFDEASKQFSLAALTCLCSQCHLATHFGFASVHNKEDKALKHLCKVNHWSISDAQNYLEVSFETHARQSQIAWKFNQIGLEQWLLPMEVVIVKNFLRLHNLLA